MAEVSNYGAVKVKLTDTFNGAGIMPVETAIALQHKIEDVLTRQEDTLKSVGMNYVGGDRGYTLTLTGDTQKIGTTLKSMFAAASARGDVALSEPLRNAASREGHVVQDVSLAVKAPVNKL